MWRSRSKSDLLVHNSSSNFSFSSFKDRNHLCSDPNSQPQTQAHYNPIPNPNPNPNPQPHARPSRSPSPNPNPNPSVFNRIRLTSSVLRAFSSRPSEPDPLPVPEPESERESLAEPELPAKSNASPVIVVNTVKEPLPVPAPEPVRALPLERNDLPSISVVKQPEPKISIPGAEKRVVVYLTSLRVVRSTFEDCRAVQSILRGFRIKVDERDLSMDSSFLVELQRILGGYEKSKLTLPRVFIGGRYIGGADEVITLHETGELKKIVQGLPAAAPGVCEVCGGYRFILCDECDGSHKCYTESGGGFTSCTSCNENGLVRCPLCACEPLVTV